MTNQVALKARITDIINEYNEKSSNLEEALSEFEDAGDQIKLAATVAGTYGQENINTGSVHIHTLRKNLLKSAWLHVYQKLNIENVASANDKQLFQRSLEDLPDFSLENIRETFGDYLLDPRASILRGLAEVFSSLDQAYKSHEKVKIGVKGLPKRVILSGMAESYSYGADRLKDILNALAQYQGKPQVSHMDIMNIFNDGECLVEDRGVWLKRFKNGNAHLFFAPQELRDINMALAEYYGDVLCDCSEEKPTKKKQSTDVSKDLQYYPTPSKVVRKVVDDLYIRAENPLILEPSCGCGRFMDALAAEGYKVHGIEYDVSRAQECRDKGHAVYTGNFLETVPTPEFDAVVMNPPFYGKHYAKHIEHALKFLKKGGVLKSILPATARYDHGLVDGRWEDLPIGSFSESGTNINTVILTIIKE